VEKVDVDEGATISEDSPKTATYTCYISIIKKIIIKANNCVGSI
jgi:hypothetical protein